MDIYAAAKSFSQGDHLIIVMKDGTKLDGLLFEFDEKEKHVRIVSNKYSTSGTSPFRGCSYSEVESITKVT